MNDTDWNQRLSQINTLWSMIFQAHCGKAAEAMLAQQELLHRYAGAVYRYLLKVVGDPDVADDLGQEFAYRFVRGDFWKADPQRGRFRNFVKTVILNLVADYYRRQKARPQPRPPEDLEETAAAPEGGDLDREFLDSWRRELLARAWEGLARWQAETGQPYYAVLRLRTEQPTLRSAEMAVQLSAQWGKAITAAGVRQLLHRARIRLAELLIDEVRRSLADPTTEQLQEELGDLGLLEYCRPVLERRESSY
jgi:RNA polymerase sigma-70 factor (ECF subfamily)